MNDNPRELRGFAIAALGNQIQRIDDRTYRVKSQNGNGSYVVIKDDSAWKCTCPDFEYRNVKCKHVWAVEISFNLREQVRARIIEPITNINTCLFCKSDRIVRDGLRHNMHGDIQKFHCKDCGHYFTVNLGFERMKVSPQAITSAMQLYFTGESLRNVQKFLKLQGVKVSHVAIYKWILKYIGLMEKYLSQITPKVSDTWRADEMWLKIKGNPKYLYALMDDETRFWIAKEVAGDKFSKEATDYASNLFAQGKRIAGKIPMTLITDGLHAYHLAWKRELHTFRRPQAKHIEHATWRGKTNDNRKMERFNGEIRDREKVMRGLKNEDTPIISGYQIYHNYVRPHEALDGQTPAEACGIQIKGENKWITLIQNAGCRQD